MNSSPASMEGPQRMADAPGPDNPGAGDIGAQPSIDAEYTAQEEHETVCTVDSNQLKKLPGALDMCSRAVIKLGSRLGKSNRAVLDLSGRTYQGKLKGPLVMGSNTSMVNGVLQLPSRCQLLIRGAQGVTLKNVVIRALERHSEQALLVNICEGSSVSMHGCTVEGAAGVMVEGDSMLNATECIMIGSSGSGLCVGSKGRAALDRCKCEGSGNLKEFEKDEKDASFNGCAVWGQGSSLTAKGCTFHGQTGIASGLCIYMGAKAVVHGCVCSGNCAYGIHVSGHLSSLIASDCSACSNSKAGIQVIHGASVVLNGCKFDGGRDGVRVNGAHTLLKATGCSASGNQSGGMVISEAGSAQLSACVMEANQYEGLIVCDFSTAASATECRVGCNTLDNVAVGNGAHLDLHECEANQSKSGSGIHVFGKGSMVVCSGGTSARGNHEHDLQIDSGSVVELTADCVMGQAGQQ